MWNKRRIKMVEEQIISRGVRDTRVIEAMKTIPRHLFVDKRQFERAYTDHPLPIGEGQTISQPYIVAYMLERLNLKGYERVLEVGTGSGYEAALLSVLCREVVTIERVHRLAERASVKLREMKFDNIEVVEGNGYNGWKSRAPYDVIILSAAPEYVPENLITQLAPGGRMIMPLGRFIQELIIIYRDREGNLTKETLLPVMFVPMVED